MAWKDEIEDDRDLPLSVRTEYTCESCGGWGGEFLTCGCHSHCCEDCALDGLCPLCHVDLHGSPVVIRNVRSKTWTVIYERGGEMPSRHERTFTAPQQAYMAAASEASERCDLKTFQEACAAAYLSWLVYPDAGRAAIFTVMRRWAKKWDAEAVAVVAGQRQQAA